MKNGNRAKARVLAVAIAIIVMAAVVVAYTYIGPIPNPGHGADEVWIDTTPSVAGGEMTVQDAVAAGFLSIDTKCNTAGSCAQVCIGGVCRNSWPSGGTGITRLSAGLNITLSPSPITGTGMISGKDDRCDTAGKCSQLCIGSDCRNSWPVAGGNIAICGRGVSCNNIVDCDTAPCGKGAANGDWCGLTLAGMGRCCECSP